MASLVARAGKDTDRCCFLLNRALSVEEASIDGRSCGWERSGDFILLFPPEAVGAGAEVTLRLGYRGTMPAGYVGRCGGDLWVELHPQGFWYPVARFDTARYVPFDLRCELPRGLQAAASADLIRVSERRESVAYAWSNNIGVPMIAMLAGPYTVRHFAGEQLRVRCYLRPDMVPLADALCEDAARVAGFYAERFGAPAGKQIAILVPPHSVGGNWAQPNMIVAALMSRDDPVRRFSILTHEIAHQWWGHAVRFDFMSEIWLPEGLTEFSGLCARMTFLQDAEVLEEVVTRTVSHYERARQSGLALGECRPDSSHSEEIRETGGAVFLLHLRAAMRAHEFDRRLRAFLERNKGRVARAADFVETMTEGSPLLLSLAQRWLDEPLPAAPELRGLLEDLCSPVEAA